VEADESFLFGAQEREPSRQCSTLPKKRSTICTSCLLSLYRSNGNLEQTTCRPTSEEAGARHRSDRPIVVETATRQAEESGDDASRHLRVSITAEAITYDYPPLLSPASGRSPSGLIWSTPFSPPSHSATVLIRGRVFLNRKPKLATSVETFRPPGLREPKFVSSQSSLPRRAIAAGNRNVVRDIDLIFCAPLRRVLAVS